MRIRFGGSQNCSTTLRSRRAEPGRPALLEDDPVAGDLDRAVAAQRRRVDDLDVLEVEVLGQHPGERVRDPLAVGDLDGHGTKTYYHDPVPTVRAELPVNLDGATAWRRLRDLSAPHLYVPGLTGAAFTGRQREGAGTRRRVRAAGILTLDETVTEWRETAGLTLRLHRGDRGPPLPFRAFLFDYGLVDRGGRTWLVNQVRYSLRRGPWGTLDRVILRPFIARLLRDITLAQKIHYETGARVTAATLRTWKASKMAEL